MWAKRRGVRGKDWETKERAKRSGPANSSVRTSRSGPANSSVRTSSLVLVDDVSDVTDPGTVFRFRNRIVAFFL